MNSGTIGGVKVVEQVTSLALSKRLKELGVKQESLFYWTHTPAHGWRVRDNPSYGNHATAAFTVAELGELLPNYFLQYSKDHLGWIVTFRQKHHQQKFYADAPTEADARAKMLIALLERGLMSELVATQDSQRER